MPSKLKKYFSKMWNSKISRNWKIPNKKLLGIAEYQHKKHPGLPHAHHSPSIPIKSIYAKSSSKIGWYIKLHYLHIKNFFHQLPSTSYRYHQDIKDIKKIKRVPFFHFIEIFASVFFRIHHLFADTQKLTKLTYSQQHVFERS